MSNPSDPQGPPWPEDDRPELDEPDIVTADPPRGLENYGPNHGAPPDDGAIPARPLNWRTLTADEAEQEWLTLNEWVNWLRREFGLTAAVLPPLWHRHPELVWELSALHQRWLAAYDPYQDPSAPLVWMAEFATARQRLHEWVAVSGTRLDRDRPTRQTAWPGEDPPPIEAESRITDRADDFVRFVVEDVDRRRASEEAFLRDQPDVV